MALITIEHHSCMLGIQYPLLSGVLDINEQPGNGDGLEAFCLEIDEDMETSFELQHPETNNRNYS